MITDTIVALRINTHLMAASSPSRILVQRDTGPDFRSFVAGTSSAAIDKLKTSFITPLSTCFILIHHCYGIINEL